MAEKSTRPLTGHIFAFVTADRVRWDEGSEDSIEENGWVDPRWSKYVLHESRNDVRPVVDVDLSDREALSDRETLEDEVRDALGWLEGGYEDNGDGTFYAADSYKPYDEPWSYSYALHFVRKYLGKDGYIEVPWHPVMDGGFEL